MRRLSLYITLFFALNSGALTGCASRWVRTPVVDQKLITVSLERKIVKKPSDAKVYSHPCVIESKALTMLLGQLEYLAEPLVFGEPEQEPVFQPEEILRLAPALSTALAKAYPDQRVRFVSRNRGGGLLFKKDRKTTGVVFVEKGNQLNLAFAEVNYEILTNEMTGISQTEKYPDPLSIKSSFTPLVVPPFAEPRLTEKGNPYPLWLVVDIDDIPDSEPAPPTAATPDDRPSVSPEASTPVSSKTRLERSAAGESPDDSWDTRKQEYTEKLQYLKELHESGLIDNNEYKNQKEKLLNQL